MKAFLCVRPLTFRIRGGDVWGSGWGPHASVREACMELIALLAQFDAPLFASTYISTATTHVTALLGPRKDPPERILGFQVSGLPTSAKCSRARSHRVA